MKNSKKPFKFKKRWIIICALVVLAGVRLLKPADQTAGYVEQEVSKQNIVAYNSFVGNVIPGADQDILPEVTSTVTEMLVEKGQTVHKGQIIAKLNTENVNYNIEMQQTSVNQASINNYYTIAEAERQYNNFKESVDAGLNPSLQAAQSQLDSAWASLHAAETAYNDAVAEIEAGTYKDTYDLKLAVDAMQTAKNEAQSAYDQARNNSAEKADYDAKEAQYQEAKTAYDTLKAEYDAADEETKPSLEEGLQAAEEAMQSAMTERDSAKAMFDAYMVPYESALSQAKEQLGQAQTRYDNAKDAVLSGLKNALDNACIAYNSAYANAESTRLSVDQQLETYSSNVDRARATSNTATSQLELNHLRDSLSNYNIEAPADGVITQLNITVGSMVTGNTPVGKIANLNSMKIEIKIDEYSILNAKVGSEVSVYVDAIKKTYPGKLTYVAPTATVTNGVSYYDAEVVFTGDDTVRSGMSVEVRLTTVDLQGVVALPSNYISYHEDHSAYVMVYDNAKNVVEREVTIGSTNGTYTEILSGLAEGERILVKQEALKAAEMTVEVYE